MKTIAWSSELKTVLNADTGKKRYYIRVCDVWRRVSKADYDHRLSDADRMDCLLSNIRGNLIHQSKIAHGLYHSAKRND